MPSLSTSGRPSTTNRTGLANAVDRSSSTSRRRRSRARSSPCEHAGQLDHADRASGPAPSATRSRARGRCRIGQPGGERLGEQAADLLGVQLPVGQHRAVRPRATARSSGRRGRRRTSGSRPNSTLSAWSSQHSELELAAADQRVARPSASRRAAPTASTGRWRVLGAASRRTISGAMNRRVPSTADGDAPSTPTLSLSQISGRPVRGSKKTLPKLMSR